MARLGRSQPFKPQIIRQMFLPSLATDTRNARVKGLAVISDNRPARTKGKLVTSDTRNARIRGTTAFNYALQFDGTQNDVSLGTMGNFGSNLANGFYCSFQIKTTSTAKGVWGFIKNASSQIGIIFNSDHGGGNISHDLRLVINDNANNSLAGAAESPTINFNDGNPHIIVMTANFTTKTITILIDGVSQTVTYGSQGTLASFVNFPYSFILGGKNNNGTVDSFFAATIDNLQIGTSSSVLYGSYVFNEGSGSTTADASGQGNGGTLSGSPLPTWVSGLGTVTSDTRNARTHGVAIINDTRNARIKGVATTNDTRSARTKGLIVISDTRPARIKGIATINDTRPARIKGNITTSDSRGAKTSGVVSPYTYLNTAFGNAIFGNTYFGEINRVEKIKTITTSSRGARIKGVAVISGSRNARTHGMLVGSDTRGARTRGKYPPTAYTDKYSPQGTGWSDKYTTQNTNWIDKY